MTASMEYLPKVWSQTLCENKMDESLCIVLKEILSQELIQPSGLLAAEHCCALLEDPKVNQNFYNTNNTDQILSTASTNFHLCRRRQTYDYEYPSSPLYVEVAKRLAVWMTTGSPPSQNLQKFDLLKEVRREVDGKLEQGTEISPILQALGSSWDSATQQQETKIKSVATLVKRLGAGGLLDVLGMRHTVGSIESFPPSKNVIIESFSEKHKPNATLSVGARALSKHVHRDQSKEWWGEFKGSEQEKNERSLRVLFRILNDAAWINIHSLPGELKILEVRCSEGYGARWTHDCKQFRGFLEPQMVDGHASRWKH